MLVFFMGRLREFPPAFPEERRRAEERTITKTTIKMPTMPWYRSEEPKRVPVP